MAQRVAEEFWGYAFEVLIGPSDTVQGRSCGDVAVASGSSVDVETLEAATLMAAHESSEHAARMSGVVESDEIERIQEAVADLARRYQRETPLRLLAEARHLRNLAYVLLERTRRPSQAADLYLVAGEACGLLSVASFDMALWDAAQEQARSAYTYGEVIGHAGLRAWARGTQALIVNWMGQHRRAVELAAAGIPDAPSGVARARLRAIEARAWSDLGQSDRVAEALRLADADLDTAGLAGDDLCDGIGGEFGWGSSRHAACAGTALLGVGDAGPAIERIRQAIALLPEDPLGGLEPARAQIDLATAELIAGHLDASLAALDDVWALPAPHRRLGLTGRLDRLAHRLTGLDWRDSAEACELRDRIEVFNAEAATRLQLPVA